MTVGLDWRPYAAVGLNPSICRVAMPWDRGIRSASPAAQRVRCFITASGVTCACVMGKAVSVTTSAAFGENTLLKWVLAKEKIIAWRPAWQLLRKARPPPVILFFLFLFLFLLLLACFPFFLLLLRLLLPLLYCLG